MMWKEIGGGRKRGSGGRKERMEEEERENRKVRVYSRIIVTLIVSDIVIELKI